MATATLVESTPVGSTMKTLTFDRAVESYTTPGQYLVVTLGEHKPGYFAIASSPGEPITLLAKEGGETADALMALEPGAQVDLSEAQGKGFGLADLGERELVILVNGSGMSAIRPVVAAELASGLARPVHVYLGVRHHGDVAFAEDLESWTGAGVAVHVCLSKPHDGWQGRTGYVQHAAREDGLVHENTAVVLCGVRDMATEAKEMMDVLYSLVDAPHEAL